jgi:hypothetical protein
MLFHFYKWLRASALYQVPSHLPHSSWDKMMLVLSGVLVIEVKKESGFRDFLLELSDLSTKWMGTSPVFKLFLV